MVNNNLISCVLQLSTYSYIKQIYFINNPINITNGCILCNFCLQGKVEMELELVTAAEAEQKPCGKGREEPNQYPKLEEPK